MVLVDKDILSLVNENKLITSGFCKDNLNCVSYDLTIDCIIDSEKEEISLDLQSGMTVFIKTKEQISIPKNLIGVIGEKNSLMRLGLKVDAPRYFPEHTTYCFLRVQNISNSIIKIHKGMKIAQIFFEELTQEPTETYETQEKKSFQNENEYRGLGNYKDSYEKKIKEEIKIATDEIEEKENKIYTNAVTLMGIVVSVFAILSINYQAFTQATVDFKFIIAINISLGIFLSTLFGLILVFFNRWKNKFFLILYIILSLLLQVVLFFIAK